MESPIKGLPDVSEVGTVLVVEDEPAIAESVAYALRREGFVAHLVSQLQDAKAAVAGSDLILLDLMLPDGSGRVLIDSLRAAGDSTPVIVLSSRDAEVDRIGALDAGADDYVTKPFSPREVVARVRAVLRRVESEAERAVPPLTRVCVHIGARRVSYGEVEVELTRVEFDVLAELASRPEQVFARADLIDRVWGSGFAITDRTVDSHVKSLRRKLSDAGAGLDVIQTVRGVGYRVSDSVRCEMSAQ